MKPKRLCLDTSRPLPGPAPAGRRSPLINPSTSHGGSMPYSNPAHFRSGRARSLLGLMLAAGLSLAPPAQALTPGEVLVIDFGDFGVGTGFQGALFVVDPATGARTLLSDFGSGANQGSDPVGMAVVPDTTAPDTSLTSTPPNPDTSTSPSFGFSGTDDATPLPASASNAGSTARASAPAPVPRAIPA